MTLITINQVNCKDCYKCVRYCPVKAIRVTNGHAEVDEERCLSDGGCVQVCPQHAKQVRSDIDIVKSLLASGRPVIASIAPSALGVFGEKLPTLIGIFKQMGFTRVEETARTAKAVAFAHADLITTDRPLITSSCPAVVSLIEKYYPQYLPNLATVPSPMVAHARLLREEYGEDCAVVFIGPCIAKKAEAGQEMDAVMSFDEVRNWLLQTGMSMEKSALASSYDNTPAGTANLFPLLHGLLRTADIEDDALATKILTVAGLPAIISLMDEFPSLKGVEIIEALACEGGCLQGPGANDGPSPWQRRQQLLQITENGGDLVSPHNMARCYIGEPLLLSLPSEEEITAILHRTGKHRPEDSQNCGACGYNTCREKAIAVFQGMAEAEMCVPYMRSRAESFSNVVIRNTPNGIVIVDKALRILDANPAFCTMFNRQVNEIIGRPLKTICDADGYERVNKTARPFGRHEVNYGELFVREMIFPVIDEDIIIGIYVDVTSQVTHQLKQQAVKHETLQKAHQVIENQMRVAQEIAGLLGETTAETKVLLTRLIRLYDDEEQKER